MRALIQALDGPAFMSIVSVLERLSPPSWGSSVLKGEIQHGALSDAWRRLHTHHTPGRSKSPRMRISGKLSTEASTPLVEQIIRARLLECQQPFLPGVAYRLERLPLLDGLTQGVRARDHVEGVLVVDILVRRLLPAELFAVEVETRFHDGDPGQDGPELLPLEDVYLYAPARL